MDENKNKTLDSKTLPDLPKNEGKKVVVDINEEDLENNNDNSQKRENGSELDDLVCVKCGSKLNSQQMYCPMCGEPVSNEHRKDGTNSIKNLLKKDIKGISVKKICIAISIIICCCIGFVVINNANVRKQYESNLKDAVSLMYTGALTSENTASMIHDVWYNTIFEKADLNTNKYTLQSWAVDRYANSSYINERYFNDDFNDSLQRYFSSSEYVSNLSSIERNQKSVSEVMSKLSKTPKGYETQYSTILELYDNYLGMVSCATDPKGNLTTYTSSYNDYDSEFYSTYKKAKLFVDNY